jgi:hypothetical protein
MLEPGIAQDLIIYCYTRLTGMKSSEIENMEAWSATSKMELSQFYEWISIMARTELVLTTL